MLLKSLSAFRKTQYTPTLVCVCIECVYMYNIYVCMGVYGCVCTCVCACKSTKPMPWVFWYHCFLFLLNEFSSQFQNIIVRGSPLQEIETGGQSHAWSRSKGSQTVVVHTKGNMSWYMLALSLIPPLHLIIVWLRVRVSLCSPGTYLRQASNSERCTCLCPLVQCIF